MNSVFSLASVFKIFNFGCIDFEVVGIFHLLVAIFDVVESAFDTEIYLKSLGNSTNVMIKLTNLQIKLANLRTKLTNLRLKLTNVPIKLTNVPIKLAIRHLMPLNLKMLAVLFNMIDT